MQDQKHRQHSVSLGQWSVVSGILLPAGRSQELAGKLRTPSYSFIAACKQKQCVALKAGRFTKMCNYCVRKRDLIEDTVLIENAVWELKRTGKHETWKRHRYENGSDLGLAVHLSSPIHVPHRDISSQKQTKDHQERRWLWEEPFSGCTVGTVLLWYNLPQ